MTDTRDYLQEALDILEGHTMLCAEKLHLQALWDALTPKEQYAIKSETCEEFGNDLSPDVEYSVKEMREAIAVSERRYCERSKESDAKE